MHNTERLRNIEDALNERIQEVDSDFNEALQSLIIARSKGDNEVPDYYRTLHAQKSVYNAISGILYALDAIDLDYRMEMILKLAERGTTMDMAPISPITDELTKSAWQEILDFFEKDEEDEWKIFSSKNFR